MTKTLDELYQDWIDAGVCYHRAAESEVPAAQRAMREAFEAYFDAKYDADGRLKPCESSTTPAPPPPLPQ